MKKTNLVASIFLSFVACASSFAQPMIEKVNDPELLKRIQENQPAKVIDIYKTELPGIFEVHTDKKHVLYTNIDAKTFFIGAQLVDFKQRLNYTQDRKVLTQLVSWDSLPHADSFTVKKGNGERKIAVFTDPDCPYCKKLETDLKDIDNVTISYFMLPIETLHPKAKAKAGAVLCSPDKAVAWNALMEKGTFDAAAPSCTLSLDKIAKFASENRISATPTLINYSGFMIEGAPKKDRLEVFLNGKL